MYILRAFRWLSSISLLNMAVKETNENPIDFIRLPLKCSTYEITVEEIGEENSKS